MSTIKVDTIKDTNNVEVYTCKAWVNFNGSGTVAINASGNVSSITDNGTGDYTINFTNAMDDANYCFTACNKAGTDSASRFTTVMVQGNNTPTTTSLRILHGISLYGTDNYFKDSTIINVAVFR